MSSRSATPETIPVGRRNVTLWRAALLCRYCYDISPRIWRLRRGLRGP